MAKLTKKQLTAKAAGSADQPPQQPLQPPQPQAQQQPQAAGAGPAQQPSGRGRGDRGAAAAAKQPDGPAAGGQPSVLGARARDPKDVGHGAAGAPQGRRRTHSRARPSQPDAAAPGRAQRSHLTGLKHYSLEGDEAQEVRELLQADTTFKFVLHHPAQARAVRVQVVQASARTAFHSMAHAAITPAPLADTAQPAAVPQATKLQAAVNSLIDLSDPTLDVQCRYQPYAGQSGGRYELTLTFPHILREVLSQYLAQGAGCGQLQLAIPGRAGASLARWVVPKEVQHAPTAREGVCMLVQFTCKACPRLSPQSIIKPMQRDPAGGWPLWIGRATPNPEGGTSITNIHRHALDELADHPTTLHVPHQMGSSMVGLIVGGHGLLPRKRGAPTGLVLEVENPDVSA